MTTVRGCLSLKGGVQVGLGHRVGGEIVDVCRPVSTTASYTLRHEEGLKNPLRPSANSPRRTPLGDTGGDTNSSYKTEKQSLPAGGKCSNLLLFLFQHQPVDVHTCRSALHASATRC